MIRKKRKNSTRNTKISMLNLIDVIFMLLIFFMIATTFNNYTQFQLRIPKTDTDLIENKEAMIEIIIDSNARHYIKIDNNIKEVSLDKYEEEFSKIDKKLLERITLTADEHLEYKEIVNTMSVLKNQQVENISLNIQRK